MQDVTRILGIAGMDLGSGCYVISVVSLGMQDEQPANKKDNTTYKHTGNYERTNRIHNREPTPLGRDVSIADACCVVLLTKWRGMVMICPKDFHEMTRAGKGIRKGHGRCQKWQCPVCGHVVMENPGEIKPVNPVDGHELAQQKPVI